MFESFFNINNGKKMRDKLKIKKRNRKLKKLSKQSKKINRKNKDK